MIVSLGLVLPKGFSSDVHACIIESKLTSCAYTERMIRALYSFSL